MFQLKKIVLMLISMLLFPFLYSQTPIVENLKQNYFKANTPNDKLQKLMDLCLYNESLHNDTLLYYSNELKKMVSDENNIGKTALAEYFKALALYKKGLLDSALVICEYAFQGLNYDNDFNNAYVRLKRLKSSIAIRKQQYQNALENLFPMQNDLEQKKDTLMLLFNNGLIGLAYMEMGQNEEALKWFRKNLAYQYYTPYQRYSGVLYSNIAAVYNELNKNDSAEYYIKKSIAINDKYELLTPQANSYAILSDILTDTKRINEAEIPLLKTIGIRKQINDPYFIVSDMAQLGIYYAQNKQPEKGITICNEGIKIATTYQLNAKLPFLYTALAQNYKAANNKDAYINTLEKLIVLKDSIFSKNSEKALAENKAKYEAQENQLKLNQSTITMQKTRTKLLWSIAALVVALIAAAFFWRKKKK